MKQIVALSLLCGWALMTAPGTNYDLPVKQWHFTQSFDSAKECEELVLARYIRLEAKNDRAGMSRNASGNRCVPIDWLQPNAKH